MNQTIVSVLQWHSQKRKEPQYSLLLQKGMLMLLRSNLVIESQDLQTANFTPAQFPVLFYPSKPDLGHQVCGSRAWQTTPLPVLRVQVDG